MGQLGVHSHIIDQKSKFVVIEEKSKLVGQTCQNSLALNVHNRIFEMHLHNCISCELIYIEWNSYYIKFMGPKLFSSYQIEFIRCSLYQMGLI